MGAADEGCSRHEENAEHSFEGRLGTPTPLCQGWNGTRSCFVPPQSCSGMGQHCPHPTVPRDGGDPKGSGHIEKVPSTLGLCRCSLLCWRSRRQNRTTHTPHPAATEPPHPGHPRLPPQERADAPGPPGSLPASPQLLLPCIWKWFVSLCSGTPGSAPCSQLG